MIVWIMLVVGLLAIIAWLVWEYHRAPLQPDEAPEDREQFAQGSLGKCVRFGVDPHCEEWAVTTVIAANGLFPLCSYCLAHTKTGH